MVRCFLSKEAAVRVAIGLDHAGFHIRDLVLEHVVTLGHEVIDEGADPVSYTHLTLPTILLV